MSIEIHDVQKNLFVRNKEKFDPSSPQTQRALEAIWRLASIPVPQIPELSSEIDIKALPTNSTLTVDLEILEQAGLVTQDAANRRRKRLIEKLGNVLHPEGTENTVFIERLPKEQGLGFILTARFLEVEDTNELNHSGVERLDHIKCDKMTLKLTDQGYTVSLQQIILDPRLHRYIHRTDRTWGPLDSVEPKYKNKKITSGDINIMLTLLAEGLFPGSVVGQARSIRLA